MEESGLICAYLDHLEGAPAFALSTGDQLEVWRLETLARSMLDGLTVWGRELRHRPEQERSPTIIEHEEKRSGRLADVWEREIESPLMRGRLNMAQITMACALQYGSHVLGLEWQGHAKLVSWLDVVGEWPSIAATAPSANC